MTVVLHRSQNGYDANVVRLHPVERLIGAIDANDHIEFLSAHYNKINSRNTTTKQEDWRPLFLRQDGWCKQLPFVPLIYSSCFANRFYL